MDSKKQNDELRTKFFTELHDHTKAMLLDLGIDDAKATQAARTFTRTMRMQWSGGQLYIGTVDYLELQERDLKIWEEFDGGNHAALAIKYKLSLQWIYKIVEYMRAVEVARRQGSLELQEVTSD